MRPILPAPPLWVTSALYYGAWFLCVGLAASGRPWLAAMSHAAFGAWVIMTSLHPRPHLQYALTWCASGYLIDSALTLLGVISFPSASLALGPSPLWMVSLWFTLGALLYAPLNPLLQRPTLAVALGALGGPLSYLGGARTGAMEVLLPPLSAALAIGAVWAGVMWVAARR
jgi:hypothetical protein